MTTKPQQPKRKVNLDLIRGISALLVMLGHLRSIMFVDYQALPHPTILETGFYFATSLGHQMVMVFFVLSGYLVGGPASARILAGTFSLSAYSTARIARLWTVLLPALAVTAVVDHLGVSFYPDAYTDSLSRFSPPQPEATSFVTLIGNILFLQTVAVPTFGSNGPLWSLANEFWYYVMFPSALITLVHFLKLPLKHPPKGAWLHAVLITVAISVLPAKLLAYSAIWLIGVVIAILETRARPILRHLGSPPTRNLFAATAFIYTLIASQTDLPLGSDLAVGATFSGWLLVINELPAQHPLAKKLSFGLSEISFSLYLLHLPLLILIGAALKTTSEQHLGPRSFVAFLAMASAALAGSVAIWFFTERHTPAIRRGIEHHIIGLERNDPAH